MSDEIKLVIGLVGLKAAGKDTLGRLLVERGFIQFRTSDAIRADLKAFGNANPSTAELIETGSAGRAVSHDNGYWMRRLAELAAVSGHKRIVFNGVRHPDEFAALREIYGDKLLMAGVVAPTGLRGQRFLERGQAGDPCEFQKFLAIDDTDRGIGEPAHGQQVDRALACVPCENVYNNVGTLEELAAWVDSLLDRAINNVSRLEARGSNIEADDRS